MGEALRAGPAWRAERPGTRGRRGGPRGGGVGGAWGCPGARSIFGQMAKACRAVGLPLHQWAAQSVLMARPVSAGFTSLRAFYSFFFYVCFRLWVGHCGVVGRPAYRVKRKSCRLARLAGPVLITPQGGCAAVPLCRCSAVPRSGVPCRANVVTLGLGRPGSAAPQGPQGSAVSPPPSPLAHHIQVHRLYWRVPAVPAGPRTAKTPQRCHHSPAERPACASRRCGAPRVHCRPARAAAAVAAAATAQGVTARTTLPSHCAAAAALPTFARRVRGAKASACPALAGLRIRVPRWQHCAFSLARRLIAPRAPPSPPWGPLLGLRATPARPVGPLWRPGGARTAFAARVACCQHRHSRYLTHSPDDSSAWYPPLHLLSALGGHGSLKAPRPAPRCPKELWNPWPMRDRVPVRGRGSPPATHTHTHYVRPVYERTHFLSDFCFAHTQWHNVIVSLKKLRSPKWSSICMKTTCHSHSERVPPTTYAECAKFTLEVVHE